MSNFNSPHIDSVTKPAYKEKDVIIPLSCLNGTVDKINRLNLRVQALEQEALKVSRIVWKAQSEIQKIEQLVAKLREEKRKSSEIAALFEEQIELSIEEHRKNLESLVKDILNNSKHD